LYSYAGVQSYSIKNVTKKGVVEDLVYSLVGVTDVYIGVPV